MYVKTRQPERGSQDMTANWNMQGTENCETKPVKYDVQDSQNMETGPGQPKQDRIVGTG